MFDCQTPIYNGLYARWLTNPGMLLDYAGFHPKDELLDLCGGTGAISLEAIRRGGRNITLLDLNPRCHVHPIKQIRGYAENIHNLTSDLYDIVVCRQAIGYLDIENAFLAVAQILKPGGRFVFNTFVRPRWTAKFYAFGGHSYLEASAFLFNKVIHFTASPSFGFDMTLFRWHKNKELHRALHLWFNVTTHCNAKSSYWLCVKK